jgi:hypothetical protein
MKSKKVFAYFKKKYPDMTPKLATAHALGLTSQAIYAWGDDVPKRSQMLVELATNGEIKRDGA